MGLLQHQRIPIGTVTLSGREVPVFITIPWLKALQAVDAAATAAPAPAPAPAPTPAPAPAPAPDEGSDDRLEAIELGYQDGAILLALAMARIVALEQRVEALEQAP